MVFNPNFVARNYFLHLSHFIVQNCAMIAKKAMKYLRNCVELRATEVLFHLKIHNFNCDLQMYAADTRMKISL